MSANRDYLAIGLALIIALSLRGVPTSYKHQIAEHSQTALLTVGQWVFSRIINSARNEQKSRFLLVQNVELALDNMRLREEEVENRRLRQALDFKERETSWQIIPAEVIARDPDLIYDTMVINAGLDRGIHKEWPVVTAEGLLVGHVAQVNARSAVVQLIMRSRVSAVVQERRAQGVVSWVHGKRFRLHYVEASEANSIQKGDRVVSSGLGGRFPKGIPIGYIIKVSDQKRDPLFKEVFLETKEDFLGIEEVFVIQSGEREERGD